MLVRQAAPDSAVYRALHPKDWQRSIEVDLLQALELRVRQLMWQNSEGRGPKPEPIPMPWDEPDVTKPDGQDWDSVMAQMNEHHQRHLRSVG